MPTHKITFHFYSLLFTPYSSIASSYDSNSILRAVLTQLTNELHENKGYLIDKHQNREDENPRELFMNSVVFMPKLQRVRCSLALLRKGGKPKIKPKHSYELVPITQVGSIAEVTHFTIDYSGSAGIVCIEYNHYGPRMHDLLFYLRSVAKDVLRLSKATKSNMYMSNRIDETLKNLKNVLHLEIKMKPENIAKLDMDMKNQYFTGMNTIGSRLKPKFLRIEAYFQTPGQSVSSNELNTPANGMVAKLLSSFKARPQNIDQFEDFVVKYEDENGNEDFFNLINGKRELEVEVDPETLKGAQWYEIIEEGMNDFMDERKTS